MSADLNQPSFSRNELPDLRRYSAVFFDVGNVLVMVNFLRIVERLSRLSNIKLDGQLKAAWNGDIYIRFEKGAASPQEFYRFSSPLLGNRVAQEDFWNAWNDCFDPIEEMIELARVLKKQGQRLYVISNSNFVHGNYLLKTYPFFKLMDGIIWSYEVGCRKPEKEIYEKALSLARIKRGEGLFFDDRPENIEGARAAGLDTVLCDKANLIGKEYLSRPLS